MVLYKSPSTVIGVYYVKITICKLYVFKGYRSIGIIERDTKVGAVQGGMAYYRPVGIRPKGKVCPLGSAAHTFSQLEFD